MTRLDDDRPQVDDAAAAAAAAGPDVVADAPHTGPVTVDDGRRRRVLALIVVGVAVVSAGAGALVGSRLKSPADAAQDRRPPVESRITIPVTRQALSSSITLAGEIQFAEPTPIKLAGGVGIPSADAAVVTKAPQIDDEAREGDVLFDISGRPVFVMQGDLPTYRSLAPGTEGPDVLQLEQALVRMGYNPGAVDRIYDGYTAAALDAMYSDAGYRSVGPSDEESDRLRQLRTAVTDGEEALTRAEADLASAGQQTTGAQLLGLQQAAAQAADAVPLAETRAARNNDAATQAVTAATTARDASVVGRDAARTLLDLALAPGAIDPATGDPYTEEEVALRRGALAEAEVALSERATALTDAQSEQTSVATQGTLDIEAARDAKNLAAAQLSDALKPPDTDAARRARDDAAAALLQVRGDYDAAQLLSGTRLPAGEMVFVPVLPATITDVAVAPGGPASEVLATISSATTQVVGRVSRADSGLVQEGATVVISLRDFALDFEGVVSYVGQPQGASEGEGSGSGRLEVIVEPTDPAAIRDYVFASARIIVDVASTGGEVLVVPVAAVSLGADGTSRVEVEHEPITDDGPGRTESVTVEVGLTADGLVEIRPVNGQIDEGDRVVVGTEISQIDTDQIDTDQIDSPPATNAGVG